VGIASAAALLGLVQLGSLASRSATAQTQDSSDLPSTSLQVGTSTIDVRFSPGTFELPQERIVQWIENSAKVVQGYYGEFPVPHVRVRVNPRSGGGIGPASTYGPDDARIRISLGRDVAERQLEGDWVMIHEFVHLAFPWMRGHDWLGEGLATYVEPIARGQAGQLSTAQVWEDLLGGMPQGLPRAGDRGLDHTPTWGRTYWGGALFCFAAEIEIRRRTENRHGLQDALRGILSRGGSIGAVWTIEQTLAAGDDAVGVPVLSELYERLRAAPVAPDLAALGKELGLELRGDEVVFDDDAPLAALRRAITAPLPAAAPRVTALTHSNSSVAR
jgi:hypothetical protein